MPHKLHFAIDACMHAYMNTYEHVLKSKGALRFQLYSDVQYAAIACMRQCKQPCSNKPHECPHRVLSAGPIAICCIIEHSGLPLCS